MEGQYRGDTENTKHIHWLQFVSSSVASFLDLFQSPVNKSTFFSAVSQKTDENKA